VQLIVFLLLFFPLLAMADGPTQAEVEAKIAVLQVKLAAQYGNAERGQLLVENANLNVPRLQQELGVLQRQLEDLKKPKEPSSPLLGTPPAPAQE
jgi:uncharacterized coiled-coil protein SlyX